MLSSLFPLCDGAFRACEINGLSTTSKAGSRACCHSAPMMFTFPCHTPTTPTLPILHSGDDNSPPPVVVESTLNSPTDAAAGRRQQVQKHWMPVGGGWQIALIDQMLDDHFSPVDTTR